MNWAELVSAIEDTTENTFTNQQLGWFVSQTEQLVYTTTDFPTLRLTASGDITGSNNNVISLPNPTLSVYTVYLDVDGTYTALLLKDKSFLREAYPAANTGTPIYYAQTTSKNNTQDNFQLEVAPAPTGTTQYFVEYAAYPTSIVGTSKTDTLTSWLGDNFSNILLNGALVEAARFMKAEPDIVANYQQMLALSMQLFKNTADVKLINDTYRQSNTSAPVAPPQTMTPPPQGAA